MKFSELPLLDRKAIKLHIKCLKKETGVEDLKYELYDSPSLYIIYVDDDFNEKYEDIIDGILDKWCYLDGYRDILIAPKKFKFSYEIKIEMD